MVVVDNFTKYAHFFFLSNIFKASAIIATFMEKIQELHENPNIIVSDKNLIFIGNF
jgi:hypothetical protein